MERQRQWHTDKRHFKQKWEDDYFFAEISSKAVCLICQQSVAVLKEYNIRHHYETKHAVFSRYKGEARKKKSSELLSKLRSQQATLTRPSTAQDCATRASYEISALIAKSGRSFSTGDFVKECLSTAASIMCPSQERVFSQISLSRNTVTRRVEDLSRDIRDQLTVKSRDFVAFSLACDESTDISDSAQLLVFVRGINADMEITQELAGLETLRGTTKGEDLFAAVSRVLDKYNLSWDKMVGITTDGAPAMIGKKALMYLIVVLIILMDAFLFDFVSSGNFAHFPSLRDVNVEVDRLPEYGELLSNLNKEFDLRFVDFKKTAGDMELFPQPFSVSPDSVPKHLQMELIEFQCDTELRRKFVSLPLRDFYPHVSKQRYPQMRKNAQVMLSLFGSTYICEQTFSLMNLNKIKLRGTLTDSHLQDILTLSVSNNPTKKVEFQIVSKWFKNPF
uniref:SPIN-DOC-like zinc-finger domain-containing protein n=1 Tax=Oryzias latipes TaxID=8090 RepID=A0A3P9KXR9_ORYLA